MGQNEIKLERPLFYNNPFGLRFEIGINTWKWQTFLLDKKTGETLAKIITFTSGNEGYIGGMHSLKFWLTQDRCSDYQEDWGKYKNIVNQLRGKAS